GAEVVLDRQRLGVRAEFGQGPANPVHLGQAARAVVRGRCHCSVLGEPGWGARIPHTLPNTPRLAIARMELLQPADEEKPCQSLPSRREDLREVQIAAKPLLRLAGEPGADLLDEGGAGDACYGSARRTG